MVYLCSDGNGVNTAVKILPQNGSLASRLSIKNEMAIWTQMNDVDSVNIVKYKNKFRRSDIVGFSMEYVVNARDLSKVIPKNRSEALDFSIQIFSGLNVLHKSNISHRDIKLENLLLTNDNKIKICDFGLAKCTNLMNFDCYVPEIMISRFQKFSPRSFKIDNKYDGKKLDIYLAAKVVYYLMFNDKFDDKSSGVRKFSKSDIDRFGNKIGEKLSDFFTRCFEYRINADEALSILDGIE